MEILIITAMVTVVFIVAVSPTELSHNTIEIDYETESMVSSDTNITKEHKI